MTIGTGYSRTTRIASSPDEDRRRSCLAQEVSSLGHCSAVGNVHSRRQFLAGAASLGIAAAAPLPPTPGEPVPVVVVGAGLAGLAAALTVVESGIPVLVLEARSEPGGRVRTARAPFMKGFATELGPWRIPASHRLTTSFARRFGLTLRPIRSTPKECSYFLGGRFFSSADAGRPELLPYDLTEDERRIGPDGLWDRCLAPYMALGLSPTVETWPPPLQKLEALSLAEFLRFRAVSPGGQRMIGEMLGLAPFFHTSFLANFREELQDFRDGYLTIEGGNDKLPAAMARALGDAIRYGAEVVQIERGRESTAIWYRCDARTEKVAARRVIVAVPFTIVRKIDFRVPLSEPKQRAIRELNYEPATKVVLQCRRRFWEDGGARRGGMTFTDLPIQEILYQDWSERADGRALVTFYAMGRSPVFERARSGADVIREALVQAQRIYPGLEAEVEEAVAVRWGQEPFARGAYPVFLPGQESALGGHIASREGSIHFAGDHTSQFPGWMNGALESGTRAAREVIGLL